MQTGKSIQREPRKRGEKGNTLPRKPAGGWPIMVTPLHAGGRRGKPFVAKPDGSRRELTEDEGLYIKYFKREVRPALGRARVVPACGEPSAGARAVNLGGGTTLRTPVTLEYTFHDVKMPFA